MPGTDQYQKTAIIAGFLDELDKIAGVFDHATEIAGLGVLAAPNIDNMIAKSRARKAGLVNAAGHPTEAGIESKRLIKEKWHDPIEVGGLGALALPSAMHILKRAGVARLVDKLVRRAPIISSTSKKWEEVPHRMRFYESALREAVPAVEVELGE